MGKFPVQVGFLGCSTGICAVFAAGGGTGFHKDSNICGLEWTSGASNAYLRDSLEVWWVCAGVTIYPGHIPEHQIWSLSSIIKCLACARQITYIILINLTTTL